MSRKILSYAALAAAICVAVPANAGEPEVENPDSTGFKFTDVKINPHGSVKDQNKSGTCWAFS